MERLTLNKLPQRVLAGMDLETVFMASRLIIAAERLQVFRELHGKRLSSSSIGKRLNLHPKYLELFLDGLVSMALLRKKKGLYWNSALGERYFIRERPIYWTRQFSAECKEAYEAFTVLEKILQSGKNSQTIQRKKKKSYIGSMRENPEEARDFTQMLFHFHQPDAEVLAEYLDLKKNIAVLDIGGGSGVMSIALVRKNPNLRACILDIEPVCRIAKENIRRAGLMDRIDSVAGDFHKELPPGFDVILCCDIGPLSKSLLKKIYINLPPKGLIVLVDRFLSNDRTEPLDRLLFNLAGSEFNKQTRREITYDLRTCGFKKVKKHNISKDLWVITGYKMEV